MTAAVLPETYRGQQALVHKFAWWGRRRGLEPDDALGAAHLGLAKALTYHDPTRGGAFGTVAYLWVRREVQTAVTRHIRQTRLPHNPDVPTTETPDHRRDGLASLLADLSDDARTAVALALQGTRPRRSTQRRREDVATALLDLGWCGRRVVAAFQEIAEALQ